MRSALAIGTLYVVAYVALDWVSYLHPLAPFAITPWNPPPGLSIALLTMLGLRYWPSVLAAVVLAEVLVRGGGAHPGVAAATSLVFPVGYVAVSAVLVKLRFDPRLARLRDVVLLVAVTVNGTVLVAGTYVGLLVLAGELPAPDAFSAAVRLWVGDAIGIVVTAPLIMLFGMRESAPVARDGWTIAEVTLQSLAVIAALLGVFVVGAGSESQFFYLLFLPLIWVSLREREVLDMVVAGKHNREIAQALDISARTVEVYKTRFMEKLRVERLPDLVRAMLAAGPGGTTPPLA
jgi:integral membrane sensor domain MASE1